MNEKNKISIIAHYLQLALVPVIIFTSWSTTALTPILIWSVLITTVLSFRLLLLKGYFTISIAGRRSAALNYIGVLIFSLSWVSAVFLLIPHDATTARGLLGFWIGLIFASSPLFIKTSFNSDSFRVLAFILTIIRCATTSSPETFITGYIPGALVGFLFSVALSPKKVKNISLRLTVFFSAVVTLIITIQAYQIYYYWERIPQELEQIHNWDLAAKIAQRISPYTKEVFDYYSINRTLSHLSRLNEKVELYLTDKDGNIVAGISPGEWSLYDQKRLSDRRLDIDLVENVLNSDPSALPIYTRGLTGPEDPSTFSVARTEIAGESGYLFINLYSKVFNLVNRKETQPSITAIVLASICLTVILALVMGVLVYRYLTYRVRGVMNVMQRFERNDFTQRISLSSSDEISDFATAVNNMADSILTKSQELERLDQQRRELIAGIVADLYEPLGQTRAVVNEIKANIHDFTSEQVNQLSKDMHGQVVLQSKLVNDLFELSKLEAKKDSLEMEDFPLQELLQDIVIQHKKFMEEKGIRFNIQQPERSAKVFADINLLGRGLSAIFEHILRYLGPGSFLSVSLAQEAGITKLEISAKPNESDTLSTQSDLSRSMLSGVTLNIAHQIIHLHNSVMNVIVDSSRGYCYQIQFLARN